MLTTEQVRRIAHQSGARDIEKVETDIILTYLLQLFYEKDITKHIAFKGGTMLRKMIFGQRGRYSTDLDFTRLTDVSDEGIMELMLDASRSCIAAFPSASIATRTGISRMMALPPTRSAST